MRIEVAQADGYLDAWASWVRRREGAWPNRTLLARVMEEGAWGASHGAMTEGMPESVLLTDRAVAHVDAVLRQSLKVYYLTHEASELKAARCQCSRATFWRRVERGQIAVYHARENLASGETRAYNSQAFSAEFTS